MDAVMGFLFLAGFVVAEFYPDKVPEVPGMTVYDLRLEILRIFCLLAAAICINRHSIKQIEKELKRGRTH